MYGETGSGKTFTMMGQENIENLEKNMNNLNRNNVSKSKNSLFRANTSPYLNLTSDFTPER